jgi:hypothetical protein
MPRNRINLSDDADRERKKPADFYSRAITIRRRADKTRTVQRIRYWLITIRQFVGPVRRD